MMKLTIAMILLAITGTSVFQQGFLSEQLKYSRVKDAKAEKGLQITNILEARGLSEGDLNILIVAYKAEKTLELYVKKKSDTRYQLLESYPICATSGALGPKRKQGDLQIPEGFYHVNHFNPSSNFHLSLGINYPNSADRKKSNAANPGGDIYIHGACVTIGCLPMTDDKIKEIYLYAVYARDNGQTNIPVYIFPFRMTEGRFVEYKTSHAGRTELLQFWTNLKEGYQKFMDDKTALNVRVDSRGDYQF